LLLVAVTSTAAAFFINSARNQALAAKDQETKARLEEEKARKVAEGRLELLYDGTEILTAIFKDLNPKNRDASAPSIQDVLGERLSVAAQQLEAAGLADPLVVAEMQDTVGNSLRELGHYDAAIAVLRKANQTNEQLRGPTDAATFTTSYSLARAHAAAEQWDEGLKIFAQCLDRTEGKLTPRHQRVLDFLGNTPGGKTTAFLEKRHQQQAAQLGPDHELTLATQQAWASSLFHDGHADQAAAILQSCLKLRQDKQGPDHAATLSTLHNLAFVLQASDQADQALALFQQCLDLHRKKFGDDDVKTLLTLNNLAVMYQRAEKTAEALPLLKECYERRLKKLGEGDAETLASMSNYAITLDAAGETSEALALLERCLELRTAKLGPTHEDTISSLGNLGLAYLKARERDKALPRLDEYIAAKRAQLATNEVAWASLLAQHSLELLRYEEFAAVEPLLRECLAIRRHKQPEVWSTFNTQSMLGAALVGKARPLLASDKQAALEALAEAEPFLVQGWTGLHARKAEVPAAAEPRFKEALQRLVDLYTVWEKPVDAARWQAELDQRN
jgi:hypothetical protein